jgi:alpha-amylase
MMSKSVYLVIMVSIVFGCISCNKKSAQNEQLIEQDSLSDWLPNAVIYEVNLRHHTPEGTLAAFTNELNNLKELGVNVLWFMPIQPIGELKRKAKGDVFVEEIEDSAERAKYLGSPYAIKDYTDVNPDYGTLAEFKALVDSCHVLGFKVILDWVGNHTAWDNPLINEHPEWYTKNSKGEITDPLNADSTSKGWTDVAHLNYANKELHTYMANAMKFWVDSCDVDGFRCDVAMDVSSEFWDFARKELSKSKEVFMLAESEEHDMNQFKGAFNAYYGWEVHHVLNQISQGKKNVLYLDTVIQKKFNKFPKNVYSLNFITNHDENSWNGTEFERMGEAWRAMAVYTFTAPGLPLLYTGQERGMHKRLKFFEKDTVVGSSDYAYFKFYQSLVAMHKNNAAFYATPTNNKIVFTPTGNQDLLVFNRDNGNNKVIVAINMSNKALKLNPSLPQNCKYLIQENYDQNKGELGPWGYVVVKR